MNEKFYELPPEKQQRIINAGLEVFGAHDYPQASTDDITAKAEISKGLLFYLSLIHIFVPRFYSKIRGE